ncbi:hypothetical protein FE257_004888 [Aspergillus nanangensis]|uniref:Uncharacterized protein n=1 Tax=Aspergillus nanangensis TaxID=2582783 RepID=A0AAD4CAW5_ASPNN|nr:hypothetical protein FE257_004888 [Aspergillus nanangensis]
MPKMPRFTAAHHADECVLQSFNDIYSSTFFTLIVMGISFVPKINLGTCRALHALSNRLFHPPDQCRGKRPPLFHHQEENDPFVSILGSPLADADTVGNGIGEVPLNNGLYLGGSESNT